MLLTTLAIRRPLIVLIGLGALIAFGLLAVTRLGVELFPTIDYPAVNIATPYPGAGPDAVDTLVTQKIEEAVSTANEIDYITSTSIEGLSTVTINFTEKASKDSAHLVEQKVNAIRNDLPADAKTPIVTKVDANGQAILELALGGNEDLGRLQQRAEDVIKKNLEAISGVGRVELVGGLQRDVQIQVDQRKLEAHGLSILQVTQALSADNLNVPAGNVTQPDKDWTIRLNTQAQSIRDLQNILVAETSGGPVRVRDVATVVDTYKRATVLQRTNTQPAIGIFVYKQSSANTVAVSAAVNSAVPALQSQLPAGVTLQLVSDSAPYITDNVNDVKSELMLAVLLTGLVLLVFLHTFRSTAIVLLAIPTSLISTFGVMLLLGISFNFMSLMGLALTVGILVDDSIVVLENIARHLKLGESPREAAINGRSEIGMAAIAITLVDVVVYTPIAFMTGFIGALFRDFGLVIAFATLFSLFVSFTLTPMLASRWFRPGQGGGIGHAANSRHPLALFARAWDAGYGRLEKAYEQTLRASLRVRWLVVALAIASFAGGIMLVTTGLLSTEYLPRDDAGRVAIDIEMPAGTPLAATSDATGQVETQLMRVPEVEKVFTTIGGSDSRVAQLYLILKDKKERQRSSQAIADEARTFGQNIPGMVLKASSVSSLGGSGSAAIQVRVQGEDQKVLAKLATQVADIVRSVPGTVDVSDGGVVGQPEMVINIDRDRAADLGLTAGQVATMLRTGLAGSTVGTYRPEGTKGWDVDVILNPDDRSRVEQIRNIPVITPRGATIRLGEVAQISTLSGPTQVARHDRQRSYTVTAGVDGRTTGAVSAEIQAGIDKLSLPAGYKVSQDGDSKSQNDDFLQIFQALGLSIVLMYLLMALLFESMLFPFIVMLSLPLALVGAFGLLTVTGNTLNIMSMIGMILLTGLVGKNAILMVDYTNHLRRQGLDRRSALLQAGPTRLRPILMTSMALILAMLPLAARLGDGGEWRAPLATTVIGGLLTSTLLTLLVIPSVYTLVDDVQQVLASVPSRIRRLAGRVRLPQAGAPVSVRGWGSAAAD
jgi:hydrophobic/amphiphilic exporter-1 (mainly G- bacteria), HAE1 family